jgi:hypothetical protein
VKKMKKMLKMLSVLMTVGATAAITGGVTFPSHARFVIRCHRNEVGEASIAVGLRTGQLSYPACLGGTETACLVGFCPSIANLLYCLEEPRHGILSIACPPLYACPPPGPDGPQPATGDYFVVPVHHPVKFPFPPNGVLRSLRRDRVILRCTP